LRPPKVVRSLYRITLLSSSIDQGYRDWGGPDPYIMVFKDGEKIIRTSTEGDTFYVEWGYYSKEIVWEEIIKEGKRIWGSRIDVWLIDEDPGEDDVIAHWTVDDPTKLEKLSTDGSWVKFKVKKLKEKEQLGY